MTEKTLVNHYRVPILTNMPTSDPLNGRTVNNKDQGKTTGAT
jgi:hypothetical protein